MILAQRTFGRRLHKACSLLCKDSVPRPPTTTAVSGEWLSDTYPDMSLISSQRDKLVDSLVKRIQVKNQSAAEEKIDELKQCFDLYRVSSDRFQELCAQFDVLHKKVKESKNSLDTQSLEYYDLRDSVTRAKLERGHAYSKLLSVYQMFPNVIEDISLESTYQSHLPDLQTVIENVEPPVISSDLLSQTDNGAYLTGQKALMELELSGFTADYLEECGFVPVTFPSFLRREVTEQSGMSNGLESEIYTLLTKPELHADGDSTRDSLRNRKPKAEDNFVYQARGLCELTLMTFFIRRNADKVLPIRLYSIGNQYRMPYSGKLAQSKVAIFLTASRTKDYATDEFLSGVALMDTFWKALNINVTKRIVDHHQLLQHEACAIEFLVISRHDKPHIISRMSMSCDYVSRRLMAYSSYTPKATSQSNTFCHFTTGELIDFNSLLTTL